MMNTAVPERGQTFISVGTSEMLYNDIDRDHTSGEARLIVRGRNNEGRGE